MTFPPNVLKRMAEILHVDEVVMVPPLRAAYEFIIRIGQVCERIELDALDFTNDPVTISHGERMIFAITTRLKARVEQEARRACLQMLTSSALPVEATEEKVLSRFEAVAQELEDL